MLKLKFTGFVKVVNLYVIRVLLNKYECSFLQDYEQIIYTTYYKNLVKVIPFS